MPQYNNKKRYCCHPKTMIFTQNTTNVTSQQSNVMRISERIKRFSKHNKN